MWSVPFSAVFQSIQELVKPNAEQAAQGKINAQGPQKLNLEFYFIK